MHLKPYSLKKRLILFTSLFSIIMGCLLILSAYRIALEETNEILDSQMKNLAERVAKFNPQPIHSEFNHLKHYHEEDLFVDVWAYQEQEHLHREFKVLVNPVSKAGFYEHNTELGAWQTYVIPLQDLQIQVSQQKSVRRNLAFQLASNMFWPYLLIMPLAIWGLSYIIRKSFEPFEQFKTELMHREPNELSPISSEIYPSEIVPSIQEINQLFIRISDAQQEQRQFIADAAHELRTPITALNLQTQILLNEFPSQPSLLKLSKGLARIQHLVSQLLNLAKQDASIMHHESKSQISINEVTLNCIEQLIHLALEKNIDLGIERSEEIIIFSQESALHSIIYNLIGNAVKYTPENGVINVSLFTQTENDHVQDVHTAIIQIEDSGPGIAPELYEQILKRFYRIHQHLEIGSGLGLSIVDKATERLSGKLQFSQSETLGGLQVRVELPLNTVELSESSV